MGMIQNELTTHHYVSAFDGNACPDGSLPPAGGTCEDEAADGNDEEDEDSSEDQDARDNVQINIEGNISEFDPVRDPNSGNITSEQSNVELNQTETQTIAEWRADVANYQRDQSVTVVRILFMLVGFTILGLAVLLIIIAMLGKAKGGGTIKVAKLGQHDYYVACEESLVHNSTPTVTYLTPNVLLRYSIMLIVLGTMILNGTLFKVIQGMLMLLIRIGEFFKGVRG